MRLLLALLVPAALLAQSPAPDPLLHWMDRMAQKQLDSREKAIAGVRTKAQADRRKQWVRAKLLALIGGLPRYAGPLNARVTGRLGNNSYTLEKVIFESLPGYFVTANLYLPKEPGRHPAVLLSAGHTTLGKTENYRIGANLAAKGFVALAYDPVGLGERIQALDPRTRKHAGGCCANEHLQAGAQAMLMDESVARYFIWDAMRALDYLVGRPEVDPSRIGAAGCSGGGCLTTYIAALDQRIKAAAPACFINSFRLLFAGPDPDSEMSLPQFLASGLDHADLLEMAAPTPWLILTTEGDFFTPAAARLVYEETRRWYGLYGAKERVQFFTGPGPHGTPLETREAIYGWMIRWLTAGGKGDPREQEVPLYSDSELQVTATGQVEDEPGSRKLHQLIREDFHTLRHPLPVAELSADLRRLGIPTDGRPPAFSIVKDDHDRSPRRIRITLESEPGVEISGTLYLPSGPRRKPALVLVRDSSTLALAQTAADAGTVVLELEPRDSPTGDDHRPFLGDWLTNARADTVGRNLPAMRAHDILRGVDLLSSRDDVDPTLIRAAARGAKGVWVLLAAAVDHRIGGVWLDRTPFSYVAALDGPLNTNLFDALVPGFLLHWDLADLTRALGKRAVLWTDPSDWMGHTVARGDEFQYRTPDRTDEFFLAALFRRGQ